MRKTQKSNSDRRLRCGGWLWLCLLTWPAWGIEHIKHFHSDITVQADGEVYVTETIRIQVEHNNIKRGIYRDFPTIYNTGLMTKSIVDFEVLEVLRNGQTEPHHIEALSNGVRIYIGDREQYVARGEQTYVISYRTNRQIAFLEGHDRFAWNVTGNDWRFGMNQVTATVRLPDGVSMSMVNQGVWTGFAGETNADYRTEIKGNTLQISSTQPLEPYQGMTFSLEIPKGFMINNSHRLLDFFSDNLLWVLMMLTLLALLMFYLLAWHQVGRDPEPGVIMPLFYPPKGLSPAAMRYILDEKTNHKNFTAALINLAVKGHITIKKIKSGYQVSKTAPDSQQLPAPSAGEKIILKRLLGSRNSITIDKKYDPRVKTAIKQVSQKLISEYKQKCFKDNRMLGYFGIGISALVLVFFMLHMNLLTGPYLARSWAPLIFTFFVMGTIFRATRGWLDSMAVLIHGILMVVGFGVSVGGFPTEFIIMSVFLVVVNGLFIYLLKSPTPFGRELMDQIEGFKLYLSTAEQHRLDIMHPPAMSSELFEKYLPYAIALGVENQWSDRFAEHLRASGTDPGQHNYSPDWYSGGQFNLSSSSGGIGDLSRSMAASVSAAAVPPSSSSGGFSSGGGFSGGGGGGGGGGGW